jgi:hypothetical protein
MSGIKRTTRDLARERCDALTAAAYQRAAKLEAQIGSLRQTSQKMAEDIAVIQKRADKLETQIGNLQQTSHEIAGDIAAATQNIADQETQIGNGIRQLGHEISEERAVAQASASEQARIQAELKLLRSESAAYAYASLVALEKQGYQLRKTVTGRNIQAWFEEQGNPSRIILLTISEQGHEETSWLEELKMTGFEDDCLDVLDLYDNELEDMGIRKRSRNIIKPDDPRQGQRQSSTIGQHPLERE